MSDALNVTPGETFVFTSSKENKVEKSRGWKQLDRSIMDEKGVSQSMDLDPEVLLAKLHIDSIGMVGVEDDGGEKRLKSSPSCNSVPIIQVEVGTIQPRQGL